MNEYKTQHALTLDNSKKAHSRLYCYVDESVTEHVYIVTVVLVEYRSKNEIDKQLLRIEKETKKEKRKWRNISPEIAGDYLHRIAEIKSDSFMIHVYVHRILDTTFDDLTFLSLVRSILDKGAQYKVTVIVDALHRKNSHKLIKSLKESGILRDKIVFDAKDDSDPFLRLADFFCSLVRNYQEEKENAIAMYNYAKKHGIIEEK